MTTKTTTTKVCLLAALALGFAAPALATPPHRGSAPGAPSAAEAKRARAARSAPLSDAERRARRCQGQTQHRNLWPQGTLLWGTSRQIADDDSSGVVTALDLTPIALDVAAAQSLRIEGGRLVGAGSAGPVGAVLRGTASDGAPVEVAICGAEPAGEDPAMIWYRVEMWNAATQAWENPCAGTKNVPDPRALAIGALWDARGARREVPGKFSLACENGALAKCARWGYKPWVEKDGHSLADLHQACTRMARADYCGNGRSHTSEGTTIDTYDRYGLLARTATATAEWDPARASFEAAWTPEGAACLSRTRDGRALKTILDECPGRFRTGANVALGDGDLCTVERIDRAAGPALLRNRSYEIAR